MQPEVIRRTVVTGAGLVCALGFALGIGLIGGPSVAESAGGSLAADATLIAPAGPAFAIWSVVYLGLGGYVVWQWLPAQAHSRRAIALSGWASLSMLLNALWLAVTRAGWLWPSVLVILGLAVVLKMVLTTLTRIPPEEGTPGRVERVLVDGTFGLYLGWVAVATCANIAAALVDSGVPATGGGAEVTTVVILLAVLLVAWWYVRRFRARWAITAAIAWGTGWIAVGRLTDEPSSTLVGITAAVVALGVLGLTWLARAAGLRPHPQPGAQPPQEWGHGSPEWQPPTVTDEDSPAPA